MRMIARVALCPRTVRGSIVAVVVVLFPVLAAALVPHQLLVAVTVPLMLLRLLPKSAVLPARRLKLMLRVPKPALRFPTEIPPPLPFGAWLVVIVILLSVTESGFLVFRKSPPPSFTFTRLPMPPVLPLMMVPWSISRFAEAQFPPPVPYPYSRRGLLVDIMFPRLR